MPPDVASELKIASVLGSPAPMQPAGIMDFPTNTLMAAKTCLGVVDEYPLTRECICSTLQLLDNNFEIRAFSHIDENFIDEVKIFDVILFHVHINGHRLPGYTIDSLKLAFQSAPVIILSDQEANEWVLEAFESGARGYIPTRSTSMAVAVEIIRLVKAGGTFVPPTSLHMIQRQLPPRELMLGEPFTSRQMSVLLHLTRGKSNKVIAYELGMSESTVKVHVRKIMQKMRATNRTEAAFRARNLDWGDGGRLVGQPPVKGDIRRAAS
jgi:DNA-binding NarL/FixJ family response regulator